MGVIQGDEEYETKKNIGGGWVRLKSGVSFNFMRHGLPTFPNAVIMVDLGSGPPAISQRQSSHLRTDWHIN